MDIASLLSSYQEPVKKAHAPRSEREEYIEKFRARLNAARQGTKYRPLSHVAIKQKLGHLTVQDLDAFYKQCAKARNFSSYFWYALKPQ